MSFYRSLAAALAAMVIAYPAFADDTMPAAGGQPVEAGAATTASPEQAAKLNLNTASVADLAKVNGLNRAKARAIVQYRDKNGQFNSLDDLVKVKGLKKMDGQKLKEIQDQLTI